MRKIHFGVSPEKRIQNLHKQINKLTVKKKEQYKRAKAKKEKTKAKVMKKEALAKARQKEAEISKVPDTIKEIIEFPMTSTRCPESIKQESLNMVKQNPERFILIDMIEKSEVIDSFYIPVDSKSFRYGSRKKKTYNIKEDCLLLTTFKDTRLMLCAVYVYNKADPVSFRQTNKGITANALTLLYNPLLYAQLIYSEEQKYNFWIVVMLIAGTVIFSVALYLTFFHNGGVF